MDALINRLQQLHEYPGHAALQDAVSTLRALKKGRKVDKATWEALEQKLLQLREEGLWTPTGTEETALKELQKVRVPNVLFLG